MGIGSSDSPNSLVVGRVKGVRPNGGSLGHRFNPRRADISPHVVVGSLSNVTPVVSTEFVNDLQRGSPQAVARGLLYVAGESLRPRSTGGGRIEGAECVGFFDDPHNLGVVSVGPIEDNGSNASHSHFTLVSRLQYETCGYDLLFPRARLVGAGSGLARASDEESGDS